MKESLPAHALDRVIILAAAILLLFTNLGDRALFGDEGQTGVMALQTLRNGLPVAPEYYPLSWCAQLFGKKLLIIHPWLDCYLGGLGIATFGHSALALRIPFALFGTAFFLLLYDLGRRHLASRRAVLILVAAALLNPPLLIALRAARYYPTSLVAVVAVLILWRDTMAGKRLAAPLLSAWLFILSLSFWPAGLVMAGTAFLGLLSRPRRLWISLPGLAAAAFFFLSLKFLGGDPQQLSALTMETRLHGMLEMLVEVNRWNLPLWMLLLFFLGRPFRDIRFPAAFTLLFLGSLSFGSWFAVRYMVPAIPGLLLLFAAGLDLLARRFSRLSLLLLPLLLVTNLGNIALWRAADPLVKTFPSLLEALPTRMNWDEAMAKYGALKFLPADGTRLLAGGYRGSTEGTLEFLREHLQPGEAILVLEIVHVYQFYFPECEVLFNLEKAEAASERLKVVIPNRYRTGETHAAEDLRGRFSGWAKAKGFRPEKIEAPDIFYGNPWYDEFPWNVPAGAAKTEVWVSRAPGRQGAQVSSDL